jgi:hypothetical protein
MANEPSRRGRGKNILIPRRELNIWISSLQAIDESALRKFADWAWVYEIFRLCRSCFGLGFF